MTTRRLSLGARVFKHERQVFLRLCEAVNTPRSLACFMLASFDEWDQYLDMKMPDVNSDTFPDDYLVTEAMRKNPRMTTSIDTTQVAIDKWWKSEHACAQTNELFSKYHEGLVSFSPANEALLTKTQRIIADILGPITRTDLEFCEANFRFGPGATSNCCGRDVVLSRKMIPNKFGITSQLLPYITALLSTSWKGYTCHRYIEALAGNKVTFVPKDAKTDRAIAIEPHMNIYTQLGIGALLRRKLKRFGIDLDNQADVNRSRVRFAEKDGLSTIDLTSASDTIAEGLVAFLLPIDWFCLLDTSRSLYSTMGEKQVRLSKFSSMGNGFTFELETLIFLAISIACGEADPCVFGDDIIVTQGVAPRVLAFLRLLGFETNERKTFLAGSFFESCGVDIWRGHDVRPLYFKGEFHDYTSAVIRISNKIRHYANRRNSNVGCDVRFLRAWVFSISRDDQARRTGIPTNCGDDGLVRNFDEFTPSRAKRGWDGWMARVWRCKPSRSLRTIHTGSYLASLAWGALDQRRSVENERGRVQRGALKGQVVQYDWPELGPWC